MHFARTDGKCLLHQAARYARAVSTGHERLKAAREAAGYDTASAAAEAMGTSVSTYLQHENGTRGYPATRAQRYARFFRTTPEWLLYGKGERPADSNESVINRVTRLVSVLGEVQAGAWTEVLDETSAEEVVPVYLAGFEGARLFALRIRGPSMDRFYPDGTMVIVCPAAEIGVREGDHVIVRRKQGSLCETTVKEVAKDRDGIVLWPRSTDPAFQEPMRLVNRRNEEAHDGPEIVGVVVSSYVVRPVQQKPLLNLS